MAPPVLLSKILSVGGHKFLIGGSVAEPVNAPPKRLDFQMSITIACFPQLCGWVIELF